MWNAYFLPATLEETLAILDKHQERARLIAGGTDLMLELERGVRKGIDTLVDVTRLHGMDAIKMDAGGTIHISPLVTHNDVAASPLLRKHAFPLVSACWQVGAPQIRNRATVAGNLVTASPANDTIPPLVALSATLTLSSTSGNRQIKLEDFYTGVRKTILKPDEMLVDISFPGMRPEQRGTFLKLGLRRSQAISVVNTAIVLTMDSYMVKSASITLGSVSPTIIHARDAEAFLEGKTLVDAVIDEAAKLASLASRPIDDLRGSAAYRRAMVQVLVKRALAAIRDGNEKADVPENPVLLKAVSIENTSGYVPSDRNSQLPLKTITMRINGKEHHFSSGQEKSLLRLLREDAGLIGTKEGCAEGECGACTVFMDGKAVMACLVPAASADGREITTVEGIGAESLHPVQKTFIDLGAVQCGYCTPGFIMSAVKLLEEKPLPSRVEISQAFSGNLCRCTGYYKIIQAVEAASGS